MTTPDIERLEQHLATNPRLRQAIVFGAMAAGTARAVLHRKLKDAIRC